jgi:formiminotetrahydrofolate cyclodeaminase
MAALNLVNVKNEVPDISAQKKYKMELQAEINKLRTKYNEFSKPVDMPPSHESSKQHYSSTIDQDKS